MARYRLDSIAELTRQMAFVPREVRIAQVDRAEALLHLIEPARAYPLDFVIYKITEYRPKEGGQELLTGLALQHDLGLLIEKISDGLDIAAGELSEPVLAIDDVCERFNVTSKTIQRWRRRGLPSRRFVFADGRKRVGFLLSSVERFLGSHGAQVAAAGNFTQVTDAEKEEIVRRSRRLASASHCCAGEITRRIARRLKRSPLTILHTIRKHDQDHPESAVFPQAAEEISDADRAMILASLEGGIDIQALARRLGRPRSAIYRVILDARAARLVKKRVNFFDDPIYHGPDSHAAIEAMVRQEELAEEPSRESLRVPRDLPPFLQDLYRTPLLGKGKERALFLQFNYYKFKFAHARRRLDPEVVQNRDLHLMESHLRRAEQVKNQIVQANLRLVVSVARKHLRPGLTLPELISDGNLTLMRAVEGFDVHRGNRFSTYATLSLMKGFARSVPEMLGRARRLPSVDETFLESVADPKPARLGDLLTNRDELSSLMARLDDRERSVLAAHFGLNGEQAMETFEAVGRQLGLSKERVRQIEQVAIAKLRAAAGVAED